MNMKHLMRIPLAVWWWVDTFARNIGGNEYYAIRPWDVRDTVALSNILFGVAWNLP